MRSHALTLRRFASGQDGLSAVEFALVLPVLIVLLLAGIQIVFYVNATRRVEVIAASISEMISQATPQPGVADTTVSAVDLHFGYDATLVLFPYIMKDAAQKSVAWWQDISISYASVQFTQIPSTNCTGKADQSSCYTANVVWTSNGTAGANYRPCLVPQLPADDTAPPNRTTLPRSLFGPGSIIAVDVVFTFVPTFGAKFLQPLKIARSVFVQPRYVPLIKFDATGNDGIASTCI